MSSTLEARFIPAEIKKTVFSNGAASRALSTYVSAQEPLGVGAEKKVYPHPSKQNAVVGIYRDNEFVDNSDINPGTRSLEEYVSYFSHENPERLKAKFYLTKIINTLYPKLFPDIHGATYSPHTVTVEQISNNNSDNTIMPLKEQGEVAAKIKDEVGIRIDTRNPENFMYDSKRGTWVFIDIPTPWTYTQDGPVRRYDPEKLLTGIDNNLDDKDRSVAMKRLQRLEHLFELEQIRQLDMDYSF